MSQVAIVMPYYQEKLLLAKTVMGILNQTFVDWQLFVVDDGSSPENRARDVLPHQLADRVRIIEKPNGGVSSARNAALELIVHSKFQQVAFCDEDDIWERNYLQSQLDQLAQGYDVTYSDVSLEFLDGSPAVRFGVAEYDEFPGLDALLNGNFIYVSSVVCQAECLSVGGFDSALDSIEDWDMWLRMAEAGCRFVKNKKTFITYTVRAGGMGGKRTEEKLAMCCQKHLKSGVHER